MIAPSHCLTQWPLLRLLLLVCTIFVSKVSAQEDAEDPPEFKAGLVGTVELAS